jgi:hypothetical protein
MSKNEMTTTASCQMMVNTKRGPVYFETSLEWNQAVELCRTEADKGNDFAKSLIEREDKNLFMSQAQTQWVYKLAEDALQSRKPKPEVRSIDASNVLASVAEARAKGIKKPILRLQTAEGNEFSVKYMSVGKNAGGAWVTWANGELAGKIDDCGVFTSYLEQYAYELFAAMGDANSNLQGALSSYGRMTSRCGCCGLPLTNKKSIELGIGPICLDKYGLLSFA